MATSKPTIDKFMIFERGKRRIRKQPLKIRDSTTLMPARLIQSDNEEMTGTNIRNINSNDKDDLQPPLLQSMVKRPPGRPRSINPKINPVKRPRGRPKLYHPDVPLWARKRKNENINEEVSNGNPSNQNVKRLKMKQIVSSSNESENTSSEHQQKTNENLSEQVTIKKEPIVVLENLNLPTNCRLRVRYIEPNTQTEPFTTTSPPRLSPQLPTSPKSSPVFNKPTDDTAVGQNPVFVAVEDERINSMPTPIKVDTSDMSLSSSVVCRVCGIAGANRFSIIGMRAERMNLLKLLKTYLDIEIMDNDNLPLHICPLCSQTLIIFDKFHKRVVVATNRLKAVLEENGDKSNWHKVPWYGDNILAMATASTEFLTRKHNRDKQNSKGKSKKSSTKFLTTNIEKIFGEKSVHLDPDLSLDDNFNNSDNDSSSEVEFVTTIENDSGSIETQGVKSNDSNTQVRSFNINNNELSKVQLVNIEDIANKNNTLSNSRESSKAENILPLTNISSGKIVPLKTITINKSMPLKKVSLKVQSIPKSLSIPTSTTTSTMPTSPPILIPFNQKNSNLRSTQIQQPNILKPAVTSGTTKIQSSSKVKSPAIAKSTPITKFDRVLQKVNVPLSTSANVLKSTNTPPLKTTAASLIKSTPSTSTFINTPSTSSVPAPISNPLASSTKKISVPGKSKSVLIVPNQNISKLSTSNTTSATISTTGTQDTVTTTFLLETDTQSGLNVLTPISVDQVNKLISMPNVKTTSQLVKIPNLNTLVQTTQAQTPKKFPTTSTSANLNQAAGQKNNTATAVIDLTENIPKKCSPAPNANLKIASYVPIAPKHSPIPVPVQEINWAAEEIKLLKEIRLPSKEDKYTYVVKMERKEKSEQPYYVLSANPAKLKVTELTLYNVGIISKDIYKEEVEKKKHENVDFFKIGPHRWAQHIIWLWQLKFKGDVKSYVKQSADKILEFGIKLKADFERRCNKQSQDIVNKCTNTNKSSETTQTAVFQSINTTANTINPTTLTTTQNLVPSAMVVTSPSVTAGSSVISTFAIQNSLSSIALQTNPIVSNANISSNTSLSSVKLSSQNSNINSPVILIAPNTTIPQNSQIPSSILLNQAAPNVPVLISPADQEPLYLVPVTSMPTKSAMPLLTNLSNINTIHSPATTQVSIAFTPTTTTLSSPVSTTISKSNTNLPHKDTLNVLLKSAPLNATTQVATQATTSTIDLSKTTPINIKDLLTSPSSVATTSINLVDDIEEIFTELTSNKLPPSIVSSTPTKSATIEEILDLDKDVTDVNDEDEIQKAKDKPSSTASKIQISYVDTEDRFDMECVSEDEDSNNESEEQTPNVTTEVNLDDSDKLLDSNENKSEASTIQHVDSVIWNELDTQMVVEID